MFALQFLAKAHKSRRIFLQFRQLLPFLPDRFPPRLLAESGANSPWEVWHSFLPYFLQKRSEHIPACAKVPEAHITISDVVQPQTFRKKK